MSTSDEIFIFSVCGGIILLPILGVIAVFVAGLISKRNAKQQVPMEGATFTETLDGDLTIEANRWRNGLIIAFLGATLAVMLIGLVTVTDTDRLSFGLFTLLWGAVTVPTIWQLSKALMSPRYRFSRGEQQLIIRQGRQQRALGFGELAGVTLTRSTTELTGRARGTFYLARLELKLKNGETLPLGTLSGYRGAEELLGRAQTIGNLIAQTTGAPLSEPASPPPLATPAVTG